MVHVPKCAGTSLRREIDQISSNMYNGRKYSLQKSKLNFFQVIKSKYTGSEITSTTWSPKELRKAHNEYDCVMGHIRLRDFKDAGFKDFVIIVREPRVRILSEWLFFKSNREYDKMLRDFGVDSIKTYFSIYARTHSRNIIARLTGTDIIFDWSSPSINVSCYWNDEIPKLMMEIFGRTAQNLRSNVSIPQITEIDFRILDLVHELTEKDSAALARLTNSGILSTRPKEKLDDEFQSYFSKNFNYVRTLL